MTVRHGLSRRSFLARIVGGAAAAGSALAPAGPLPGQTRPMPRPAPRPGVVKPPSPIPVPTVDSDTGRNSDVGGHGRRPRERFRPCRADSDTGSTADPRCRR